MKKILFSLVLVFSVGMSFAQTEQELKAMRKVKKDSIAQIQSRVNEIQSKIEAIPGWKYGAFGTVGVNLSEFSNWYSQGNANVSSGNIGLTINSFANLKQPKYFWRNSLNVNLGWVKFDDRDDPTDDDSFQEATDVFNISTLYGYKLTEKIAISTLGEYRTTILNNFNDPGYLDIGVGGTWTPANNLVVVVHPLNYNFVFATNNPVFESSIGAKVVADYTRSIGEVSFKTNLSMFYSYKSSNLSNYTWINSFGYTIWKNIGVGFEFGIRGNKQEALNFQNNNLAVGATPLTFDTVDNKLQSYYLVGLNYKF
ncbi:DUF3078 domain-containing protein [Nonlabens sp. Ci31]|jgi:hypothetical protein|uniref:DUF3078 domain-containing protein n=1 Tax=Nonlabens sp. Ci31 TaxID=2608253 RepID=UPI001463CC42|nr:DUF3078 domain-containing protein [Nonlabens sp. Ci31]QJP33954.1 DUF3078 domain-containing protein [Nonlabens sp. Ci31]